MEMDNLSSISKRQMIFTGTKLKIKAPIYKGKVGEKPLHFLADLKKYINTYKSGDNLTTLLSQCLNKNAKSWFYLIEKEITSNEKFEESFRKRYWNNSIQDGLRRNLNSGTYQNNGSSSRADYASRLFGIAEDLNIPNRKNVNYL